ncbi:MAG: zinc ribbon domain-containing protein [Betaproteobacteria bacterium]|nr:zinc ribbon domain-containing protein [Betaproteobacteria bacterium]
MVNPCPKCGYVRRARDKGSSDECPGCGLIFSRWERRERYKRELRQITDDRTFLQRALDCLQLTDGEAPQARHPFFWVRLVVYLALLVWGWKIAGYSYRDGEIMSARFVHLPLLVFHEAGHLIFMPLGNFMHILGGTLMQLIMPLACFSVFLFRQRDPLAASFCLWWTAVSFMDIAPYMYDALDPKLLLLSGMTGAEDAGHDWINILSSLGMLQKAHGIGGATHAFGILLMVLAQLWGALLLLRQYRLPASDGLSATGMDDL